MSKRARGDPFYVPSSLSQQASIASADVASVRMPKKKDSRGKKGDSKKRVAQSTKEYIKRVLDARIEKKQICIEQSQSFGTILESADMNMFPMCPYTGLFSIPIGTTDGTRIGNQIRVRKVTLRYVLRSMPYLAGTNDNPQPVYVQFYLGHVKSAPGALPTALELSTLYQSGSSSYAPVGDLSDLVSVVNDDYWNVKKTWVEKLGTASFTPPGGLATYGYFANNDFQLSVLRSMDITKLCPKVITFNDASGTQQGPNLFLFYQAIATTGGSLPSTQRPAGIDYWIDFEYEDA